MPGPTDEQILDVGRAVVDALRRRNFDQATRLFGPALLEALPAKALRTVWERTEERFGAMNAPMSSRVSRIDRVQSVTRTAFEKGFADVVVTFADDGTVIGLSVVPAPGPGPLGEAEAAALKVARRRILQALPFMLAVGAGLYGGLRALEVDLNLSDVYWGAAGWTVVLLLRGPLSLVLQKRLPHQRAERALQISAGVLEEVARAVVVISAATAFPRAANIAFGWAAVEVLHGAFASVVAVMLAGGHGDRAEIARMNLVLRGQRAPGGASAEVAERVLEAAYQAGATLTMAGEPTLALLILPIRAGLEAAPGAVGPRRATILRAAAGAVMLVAGLTVFGRA